MPRKYDMGKRSAAVEATRKRIVEATMELHNRQGALATSWEEIAELAGVSPATVYRHFPSLDELLPACGRLSFETLALPTVPELEERLGKTADRTEAVRQMVAELFAAYARGGDMIKAARRERDVLEPMAEALDTIDERLETIRGLALGRLDLSAHRRRTIAAMTDYGVWAALRERGIEGDDAVATVAGVIDAWLASG